MDFSELDTITQMACINIYTLSKDTKEIVLKNFNPKDENHLGLYNIAVMCARTYQMQLYLGMSWFRFLIFKFKNRKRIKLKRYIKKETWIPSCNDFIDYICRAKDYEGAFAEIYHTYYQKGKE